MGTNTAQGSTQFSPDWALVGWDLSGLSREETHLGSGWQQRGNEMENERERKTETWLEPNVGGGDDDTSGGRRLTKLNTRAQIERKKINTVQSPHYTHTPYLYEFSPSIP